MPSPIDSEVLAPPVSLHHTVAVAGCTALTLTFVGLFYLLPATPLSHRNDPAVIKRRFVLVGCTCLLSPFFLFLIFSSAGSFGDKVSDLFEKFDGQFSHILKRNTMHQQSILQACRTLLLWLGLRLPIPRAIILPIILVAILFFGPLVGMALLEELPGQRNSTLMESFQNPRERLMTWRNLIVVSVCV